MEILKWALLSLLTILLGAVAGFGLSTRRVAVAWFYLTGLIIFIFMVSIASSFIGHLLKEFLSYRFFEIVTGLLLIGIGVALVISKPIYPGHKDFLLFSLALILDVGLLSFHYGLSHEGGYGLAFTLSLLLLGSIVSGMAFGNKRWANWRLKMILPQASGMAIVLFGLMKML